MRQRLPSLSNLRAFDAAALHLNLRRAAADLYITESAVSRQIASLESLLGVQLFHRANQRITLTAAGVLYSRQVRELRRKLQRDTLDIMAHEGVGGTVELACVPTLAVEWLIPRLPGFYARHPQVIVNIRAQSDVFLFEGTPYDAAIHFGEAVYPCRNAVVSPLQRIDPTNITERRFCHGNSVMRHCPLDTPGLLLKALWMVRSASV